MFIPWTSSNIYYLVLFPLLSLSCPKYYLCSLLHNHLAFLGQNDTSSALISSSSSSVLGGCHRMPLSLHVWDLAFPSWYSLALELAPIGKIAQHLKGNNSHTTHFPSVLVYPSGCTSICAVQEPLKCSSPLVEPALVAPEGFFLNT